MAKVISVAMNKGGVGKTSIITNLAGAVSVKHPDKRTLIIDTDPQGHASLAFGRRGENIDDSTYNILIDRMPIRDIAIKLSDNLDIVAANHDLDDFEEDIERFPAVERNLLLRSSIAEVQDYYDYIFIDAPPSRGKLAINVIFAADMIIIPFVPETFSVEGLISIYEKIRTYQLPGNPSIHVIGSMIDFRTTLHQQLFQDAQKFCAGTGGLQMLETFIPKSIRVANATAYENKPVVWTSDKNNALYKSYFDILEELENA
jgi:chromosome partitioning protein